MSINFRQATKDDLETLVFMLADDELGREREDASVPLHVNYLKAFETIDKDPFNELIVATKDEKIVGMLQLTFISYLTHMGSTRCLIEGVRVHKDFRGLGYGSTFFKWAIEHAKKKGANMVQLTSNKTRTKALKFYENLGFVASHEGFKLSF